MFLKHATALVTIMILAGGSAFAQVPLPAVDTATARSPAALPAAAEGGIQPAPAPAPAALPSSLVAPRSALAGDAAAPLGNPFASEGDDPAAASAEAMSAFTLPLVPQSAAAGQAQSRPVDERALRYYAAQRELGRVAAETKRLKSLYPGWQPPADMFSPTQLSIDEQPLWDLFAKGEYGEAKRQIALRQKQTPSWRPSDDLTKKLAQGETRAKLVSAARYARWSEVVETAAASKDLLVCGNMDVLWTLGEALARTGKLAESFDVYRYVVVNCPSEQERLATVQKAGSLLPQKGQDALIALAVQASSTPAPYEAMRFDPLRRRLGAVASDATEQEVSPEELRGFAAYIDAQSDADDAGLLGWYLYATGNFDAAAAWFKVGMQNGSDPKLTEGYVLSLRKQGRNEDAEEIAYRNRLRSAEIKKSYFEIVSEQLTIEPQKGGSASTVVGTDVSEEDEATNVLPYDLSKSDLTRFAKLVLEEKSPLGSQALGWHALRSGNVAIAKDWFEKSIQWEPTKGGVLGAAVAAARLREPARLREIKAVYGTQFPELAKFKSGYRPQNKSGYRSQKKNWKKWGRR